MAAIEAVHNEKCKWLLGESLSTGEIELVRVLHKRLHSDRARRKAMKGNQIIVLTLECELGASFRMSKKKSK